METTIRRLNDHIYTLGTGVIAFAAWTLLKFTLYCTVYQNVLVEEMRVDLPADSSVLQVTIIAVWIIVFLDALFQCLIGFSARADGKGAELRHRSDGRALRHHYAVYRRHLAGDYGGAAGVRRPGKNTEKTSAGGAA